MDILDNIQNYVDFPRIGSLLRRVPTKSQVPDGPEIHPVYLHSSVPQVGMARR